MDFWCSRLKQFGRPKRLGMLPRSRRMRQAAQALIAVLLDHRESIETAGLSLKKTLPLQRYNQVCTVQSPAFTLAASRCKSRTLIGEPTAVDWHCLLFMSGHQRLTMSTGGRWSVLMWLVDDCRYCKYYGEEKRNMQNGVPRLQSWTYSSNLWRDPTHKKTRPDQMPTQSFYFADRRKYLILHWSTCYIKGGHRGFKAFDVKACVFNRRYDTDEKSRSGWAEVAYAKLCLRNHGMQLSDFVSLFSAIPR